jgi:hypothetical protein
MWIGVTSLAFCRWQKTDPKAQDETPYSEKGRFIHEQRTKKNRLNARLDEMLSLETSEKLAAMDSNNLFNFEFFMNRAYALNLDKLKCRVCKAVLKKGQIHTHRIDPNLPLDKVNKVANLASMCYTCYTLVNNPALPTNTYGPYISKKVNEYRNKLSNSNARSNTHKGGTRHKAKVLRVVRGGGKLAPTTSSVNLRKHRRGKGGQLPIAITSQKRLNMFLKLFTLRLPTVC